MNTIKLNPIKECGTSRQGTLYVTYNEIVDKIFKPNNFAIDGKVKASWSFIDDEGRKGFIWCYNVRSAKTCTEWSVDGDANLLMMLFGGDVDVKIPKAA